MTDFNGLQRESTNLMDRPILPDDYIQKTQGINNHPTKKRRGKKILALLLVAIIAVGGAVTAVFLHNRTPKAAPSTMSPLFRVSKQYSNVSVTDGASAIASMADVASYLGVRDAENEFSAAISGTAGSSNYYRLNQMYNGTPVYGKSAVVAANADGTVLGMTSNYLPIGESEALGDATVTDEQAIQAAKKYIAQKFKLKKDRTQAQIGQDYIYCDESNNTSYRVRSVAVSGIDEEYGLYNYEVLVHARSGKVVYANSNILFESVNMTLDGQETKQTVSVEKRANGYAMTWNDDNRKSISICEPNHYIRYDQDVILWDGTNIDPSAVDALSNLSKAYDFYDTMFGWKSFSGSGDPIYAYINVNGINGNSNVDNACYCPAGCVSDRPIFAFGDVTAFEHELSAYLDIVAHEYTHGVIDATANLTGGNYSEPTAVNEAYADIMGVVIRGYYSGSMDWVEGAAPYRRNLADPQKSDTGSQLSNFSQYTQGAECHDACTILSHAAYLMWTGNNGASQGAINDLPTFAELWYRSMFLMHSNSGFEEACAAVEMAADQMQQDGRLTQSQVQCVTDAFAEVGLHDKTTDGDNAIPTNANMIVMNEQGEVCKDYSLLILGYANTANGYADRFSLRTVENADSYDLNLEEGVYDLCFSEDGFGTYYSVRVSVQSSLPASSFTVLTGMTGSGTGTQSTEPTTEPATTLPEPTTQPVQFAQAPESDFEYTNSNGNSPLGRDHVMIFKYKGSGEYIKLPDSHDGKPVEGIYHSAFEKTSIKGVCIPNGIRFVDSDSFCHCDQLETVVFEGEVTDMDDSVFMGCSKLQELTFPQGLKRVNGFMCYGCSALRKVTIPDSVTAIEGCAFDGCADGLQITIPASVTSIDEDAFLGTKNVQIIAPEGSYAAQYAKQLAVASQTTAAGGSGTGGSTPRVPTPTTPYTPTVTMPSTTRPPKMCTKCYGTGKCSTCGGRGLIHNPYLGGPEGKSVCPNCTNGLCSKCGGTGTIG